MQRRMVVVGTDYEFDTGECCAQHTLQTGQCHLHKNQCYVDWLFDKKRTGLSRVCHEKMWTKSLDLVLVDLHFDDRAS